MQVYKSHGEGGNMLPPNGIYDYDQGQRDQRQCIEHQYRDGNSTVINDITHPAFIKSISSHQHSPFDKSTND
jgi:hypothetical protein